MSHDPTLAGVRARIASGITPIDEIRAASQRCDAYADPALFLHRAQNISATDTSAPLAGVAIAVKDNLDVAGMPTTAACPAFAYTPTHDTPAVAHLRASGAVVIGKTNLDQFATGLVGTRSPAGTPRNPFDATLIPGGSSSGSAVAVSAGLVPVALGTDTAGSGRVPAAFTGIVGIKPTCGWLSTRGVVPAVRSLDCVSVFAHTVADAWQIVTRCAGFDATDPFSRRAVTVPLPERPLRIGTPDLVALQREVDPAWFAGYRAGLDALCALGHQLVTIDDAPFRRTAAALYGGAWVAERTVAVGDFLDGLAHTHSPHADPTVSAIIRGGRTHDAVAAWRSVYELKMLRREAEARWEQMDVLALPTVSDHPSLAAVHADPLGVNSRMGRFTNFANLLDTCAIAVPTPRTTAGLPTGFTLFAPAWHDHLLAWLGAQVQHYLALPLGATGFAWADVAAESRLVARPASDALPVAVFGAHLRGQPLNHRLLALGGSYVRDIRSAPRYRCCLLDAPPRPGLIPVHDDSGAAFAGELWHLPAAGLGRLVTEVLFPLTLGTIELDDGCRVTGFVCADGAGRPDITAAGSWRAWLAAR